MNKFCFFSLIDNLSGTIVTTFMARDFTHAKAMVLKGRKDKKFDDLESGSIDLVQISNEITIPVSYDDIAKRPSHSSLYQIFSEYDQSVKDNENFVEKFKSFAK